MERNDIRVRLATPDDAEAILAVYTPYIAYTSITFETTIPTLEAFRERVRSIAETYPYLVVEEDSRVVGYAYASRLGERAAYAWNAELSIYFEAGHTGRGWGKALTMAVVNLLALQGVRNVFSIITVPNTASFDMHEKLGFAPIGTQAHAGYKLERWHDVDWLQKSIGDFDEAPRPIVALSDCDPAAVQAVIDETERALRGE